MAHSFKSSSGRSTFGTFKEPADAGDYILNKKATNLSEINELKLRQSVGNISKNELNRLYELQINQ